MHAARRTGPAYTNTKVLFHYDPLHGWSLISENHTHTYVPCQARVNLIKSIDFKIESWMNRLCEVQGGHLQRHLFDSGYLIAVSRLTIHI